MNRINKPLLMRLSASGVMLMSALLLCSSSAHLAAAADGAPQPGSEADPLVSKSYVDHQIEVLRSDLADQLERLRSELAGPKENTFIEAARLYTDARVEALKAELREQSSTLTVVELRAGQILTAEAGTELVVRAGEVVAITSPLGGLADVTAGVDRANGERIPKNHLLLVPRSDGRGLGALTDAVLLVRGPYTIR